MMSVEEPGELQARALWPTGKRVLYCQPPDLSAFDNEGNIHASCSAPQRSVNLKLVIVRAACSKTSKASAQGTRTTESHSLCGGLGTFDSPILPFHLIQRSGVLTPCRRQLTLTHTHTLSLFSLLFSFPLSLRINHSPVTLAHARHTHLVRPHQLRLTACRFPSVRHKRCLYHHLSPFPGPAYSSHTQPPELFLGLRLSNFPICLPSIV